MRTVRLHLDPGSDLRHTLQQLAMEERASGFVLGVVGNLPGSLLYASGGMHAKPRGGEAS